MLKWKLPARASQRKDETQQQAAYAGRSAV